MGEFKVRCPECDRTLTKNSEEAATDLVDSHNESRHDGEDVAVVVGEQDPLDSFIDALEDPHSGLFYAHRKNGVYRVMCMECEGIEVVDTTEDAWDLARRHNEFAHEGDAIAGVVEEDLEETKDTFERSTPLTSKPESGVSKRAKLLATMQTERTVVTKTDTE